MVNIVAGGQRLETLLIPAAAPGAPTLVLLHEGLGSIALWRDLPQQLATATGCAVLAYSRHGHGGSAPLTSPRTVRYMHDEALVVLPEVLAALGIERPILIGHSDGASIALIYAGQGVGQGAGQGAKPVAGLVLLAPHVFVEDITVASIAAIGRTFAETDMGVRMGRYHADPTGVFQGWHRIWLDPAFRAWNIEAGLEAITCPVLLIQGADDEYGTLAQIDAIAARVSGPVERLVLDACGHSPQRDQPDGTLGAISTFVARLSP